MTFPLQNYRKSENRSCIIQFSFKTTPKDLDTSCKTDLDFWDDFGSETFVS